MKGHDGIMTNRYNQSIYKKALRLAIPMMIQTGIANAVSLVDNLMVGSLGTESMTGVSVVGQLMFVFSLAIFGMLSGPGIYGAQFFGQGNKEGFRNIFRMKLWGVIIILVIGLSLFVAFGSFFIELYLQGNESGIDVSLTKGYAKQYLNIMLVGLVPFGITQIYSGSLREMGQSLKPMITGVISVLVDIVFNYLLIYGKIGFPRLGVQGAAIATVIARFVEFFALVIWVHVKEKEDGFMKNLYSTIKFPLMKFLVVVKKGVPIFFNEFLWAGAIATLTQIYSTKGLSVVAGLNISNAICNLLNVAFIALGNAVGIIAGHYLGASQFEKAKKNSIKLMWFTGIVSAVIMVFLVILAFVFPGLYNTTDEIRNFGRDFIIITALFFPVQGFLNALYFTLRSGGKTFITFMFDSVFSWVVTVSVAFLLCNLTTLGIIPIYIICQSVDIIKVMVGYILIKKGVWIHNLIFTE